MSFYRQVCVVLFSGCSRPGSTLYENPSDFVSRSLRLRRISPGNYGRV